MDARRHIMPPVNQTDTPSCPTHKQHHLLKVSTIKRAVAHSFYKKPEVKGICPKLVGLNSLQILVNCKILIFFLISEWIFS